LAWKLVIKTSSLHSHSFDRWNVVLARYLAEGA
jgi:hypothetical protein